MSDVCARVPGMRTNLIVSTPDNQWRVRELHVAGRLSRLRRGLYTGAEPDRRSLVEAAVVRLDAVASHETAAALWGLPTLGTSTTMHVTRTRRSQGVAHYDGVTVHHASLDPAHLAVHNGIPLTTPARTVLDIARHRSFWAGVVVADAALRMRCCTREELLAVAEACRRWPGVTKGRRVVGFADEQAESPLESISRVAFHDYELPVPILQAVIGGYERADFLWPDYRVIGEADGLGKYTSPDVLRREKEREQSIAQLGFTTFRWTWRDAFRRPDALAYRASQILSRHGYRA